MDAEMSEALAQSVRYALENMCFTQPVLAPEAPGEASQRATIPFRTSYAGRLALEVDAGAAQTLTSALLGLRPGETPAEAYVQDTVCELGTVICGQWLSTLDPVSCLHFGTPEFTGIKADNIALRLCFEMDCGYLAVSVQFD